MLKVEHIAFAYGGRDVLSDVSFTVEPGEAVGLAGANGAGKTTLLRMLAGLAVPSRGSIVADEADAFLHPLRYRRRLGYLSERAPADPDMSVKQYLKFRARLKGEQSRRIRHRVSEAMELCGVTDLSARRIELLSFGQRKRVALAEALLLRPRLLLLDDLLAGLDTATRSGLGAALGSLASFASVIVSGHELDELAPHVKRFIVLKGGVALQARNVAEVREALA